MNERFEEHDIPWTGVSVPSFSIALINTAVRDSSLVPLVSSSSDSYSSLSLDGSTSRPIAERNRDRKYPREKRYSCCTLDRELNKENIITARLASGWKSSRRLLSLLKLFKV